MQRYRTVHSGHTLVHSGHPMTWHTPFEPGHLASGPTHVGLSSVHGPRTDSSERLDEVVEVDRARRLAFVPPLRCGDLVPGCSLRVTGSGVVSPRPGRLVRSSVACAVCAVASTYGSVAAAGGIPAEAGEGGPCGQGASFPDPLAPAGWGKILPDPLARSSMGLVFFSGGGGGDSMIPGSLVFFAIAARRES